MVSTANVTSVLRTVGTEFSEKNVTFLAGSIAYTAFVSLVPLLLFVVLALALVGAGWEQRFLALVSANVSPVVGQLIDRLLQSRGGSAGPSSLVGVVVLVWGALKLFRGLDTAFEEIYEVDADGSLVQQLRDGVVVLVSLVLSVGATVAVTTAFGAVASEVPVLGVLFPVVLAAGLVVAFLPMYYVFPNTDVTAREVLPGVLVSAVGWALLQGLFQVYVVVATGGGGVSVLTGIMLLLTWLYFSGVVLLLGAVVNAVLGGHTDRDPTAGGSAATAD
ncbi:YihY/virulence factor BrkB family protein [Halomicroarcula sp. F13]|uniref:YihY/virulence factor BrkB family protein n=1 Tax=Haloarcula rubra TaxID=2487747 RepID=A0AAW4PNB7_9EURY|nr:YihY/virulence factor BrkB family protein [Halomicroarcula rubra]MBX0322626.1 YihY/virulence factor BrkB family protein [Halomicroarcula rubra]